MANVLFIWETPRPDCFHNLPNLSCISKRLVEAYLAVFSFQGQLKNVLPAKTPGNGTTPSADRGGQDRRWSCGAALDSQIYKGKMEINKIRLKYGNRTVMAYCSGFTTEYRFYMN